MPKKILPRGVIRQMRNRAIIDDGYIAERQMMGTEPVDSMKKKMTTRAIKQKAGKAVKRAIKSGAAKGGTASQPKPKPKPKPTLENSPGVRKAVAGKKTFDNAQTVTTKTGHQYEVTGRSRPNPVLNEAIKERDAARKKPWGHTKKFNTGEQIDRINKTARRREASGIVKVAKKAAGKAARRLGRRAGVAAIPVIGPVAAAGGVASDVVGVAKHFVKKAKDDDWVRKQQNKKWK